MRFGLALVVSALTLISGCAWTQLDSYKDPAAHSAPPLKYVLVWAQIAGIQDRRVFERAVADQLLAIGYVYTDILMNVAPPTRQYTSESLVRAIDDSPADGLLIVTLRDAYTETYTTPGTSQTTGTVSVYGNTAYYNEQTTNYPGISFDKPRMDFEVKLVRLNPPRTDWIATTHTQGNAFADLSVMAASVGREIAVSLVNEGLVQPKATR